MCLIEREHLTGAHCTQTSNLLSIRCQHTHITELNAALYKCVNQGTHACGFALIVQCTILAALSSVRRICIDPNDRVRRRECLSEPWCRRLRTAQVKRGMRDTVVSALKLPVVYEAITERHDRLVHAVLRTQRGDSLGVGRA